MTPYQYRHATIADANELVKLLKELGYPESADTIKNRLQLIEKMGGVVLVAEKDQALHGCVQALVDIRLAEGKVGEIVSLIVLNSTRGQGVGKTLTKKAEAYLTEHGCTTIKVRANAVRADAHEFYHRLGFEHIKTQKIFLKNLIPESKS